MKHVRLLTLIALCLAVVWTPVSAQTLPGDTVEERAINGTKAYLEEHQLQEPSLTILLISLFRNAMPAYAAQWEELTGIKVNFIEYGYTDIPSKIMAEAIAKTGQYDIFNHFPYVVPDAAGSGVLMPVDDYTERGRPDFSGIEPALRAQQRYNGKQYFFLLDGDHIILVLRKDILDLPGAKEEFQAKYGWEAGCPDTMAQCPQRLLHIGGQPLGGSDNVRQERGPPALQVLKGLRCGAGHSVGIRKFLGNQPVDGLPQCQRYRSEP